MLVTINEPGYDTAYRVDCDRCGRMDEHDRGPNGEVIVGHYSVADAYESAACTECADAPGILKQPDGRDLCVACRLPTEAST